MLHDVTVTYSQTSPWEFPRVIINGKKARQISNHSDSPTGAAGCTRQVYVGDEYVVKIGDIGEAYLFIEDYDRANFAEVVFVDINKQWLVQRRIDCIPNQSASHDDWDIILYLIQRYNIGDVSFRLCPSTKKRSIHNWTVDIQGRPVIFDYDFNGSVKDGIGYDEWQAETDGTDCWCIDCRRNSVD